MGKNKKNTAYIKQKSNQTPLLFLKNSNIIDLDLKKHEDNNLVIKSHGSEEIEIKEKQFAFNLSGNLTELIPYEKPDKSLETITVGIGGYLSLKSLEHSDKIKIIDEGQSYEQMLRILDIGPSYDSARKLNANMSIGISTSPNLENKNEENLQILSNEIDKYFLDKKIGTLSKSDNKNIERIFREARKFGPIPLDITTDEENAILPVIKPFFEEKQIPTEREFKEEAKKLKVSGNFSSLGAAQNELARRYGFKEYRAIKSRFVESLKSYDNIRNILINTSELNNKENAEIVTFFYKFGRLFRKLNISIGTKDFESIIDNEPILYYKTMERLEIYENSLMGYYRYFLTENSIVFGQIKRNISIMSQDRKISLLNDLNHLEIEENDAPVFGLFANLLAYHIGKSAGDVTLHKNVDGTIEQRFEEHKPFNSHNNEQMNQLKKQFDKMGIKQNQNSEYEMGAKIKTYNSEIGFMIYFLYNISLENQYVTSLLKKMKNIPDDFKINYHQFISTNTLNIFLMKTQPSKTLLEEFEKMILSIIK